MSNYNWMTNSDRKNFIYFIVNEKQEKMKRTVASLEASTKKYRKVCKILNVLSATAGSTAIASTGASVVTSLTGVGLLVGVPLSIVSGVLAVFGVVGSTVNDKLHKILEQKEVLLQVALAYKISLQEQIGLALSDETINTDEYTKILGIYKSFNDTYLTKKKIKHKEIQEDVTQVPQSPIV